MTNKNQEITKFYSIIKFGFLTSIEKSNNEIFLVVAENLHKGD
jgi:hypothetical protein